MRGDFDFPTRVAFGAGRVEELPELVRGWGRQALIVTDRGIAGSGTVRPVLDALGRSDLDFRVWEKGEAAVTEEDVAAGVRRFQEECDFLIAVGGGTALDAGKAVRRAIARGGALTGGSESDSLVDPLPPLAAIPTTAGTGTEVTAEALVTLEGKTVLLRGADLLPSLALCDPALIVNLPIALTAGTGADALAHNVEAYFAPAFNPLCDVVALEGLRRAMRALPRAVHDGLDLEARGEMMLAALMGGIALRKGLGVAHSLAHGLTSVAGTHHGTAVGVMLPHALRFNRAAFAPRAAAAAEALGVPVSSDPEETVDLLALTLDRLFESAGLPVGLHGVAVTHALIGPMVELALKDDAHRASPRPVTREDLAALYRAALRED